MEAIILAGGLGTRLSDIVSDRPKPMASVAGRPFLEYILRYLKKNGIDRVILSVGYKWERIRGYFGVHFEGLELLYSVEDEPLGTGGAIQKAMQLVHNKKVLIINGDTFFDVPLQKLYEEFTPNDRLLLALKNMHYFDRYGCVECDELGTVTAFTEKGFRKQGNINGGIYLAATNLFEDYAPEKKFSFERFMEQHFASLGIRAHVFENYFIDIGIPEDYVRAQNELNEYL